MDSSICWVITSSNPHMPLTATFPDLKPDQYSFETTVIVSDGKYILIDAIGEFRDQRYERGSRLY